MIDLITSTTLIISIEKNVNICHAREFLSRAWFSLLIHTDMSILGRTTTYAIQKDPLMLPGSNATIALEMTKSIKSRGISWSVLLDHLRYYGRPVVSHGSVCIVSS